MTTPTIEEIYDKQIRPRSRDERRRLVELASKDLENDGGEATTVDPTLALFARWKEEDSRMTPEEIEAEQKDWEELKANLNAERDRAGARRLFNS